MSKFNIPRMVGESDLEFRRRYNRERSAILKANKPPTVRKPRGKNTGPRKDSIFTQEEWEALRQRPDETDEEWTVRYRRERRRINADRQGKRRYDGFTPEQKAIFRLRFWEKTKEWTSTRCWRIYVLSVSRSKKRS